MSECHSRGSPRCYVHALREGSHSPESSLAASQCFCGSSELGWEGLGNADELLGGTTFSLTGNAQEGTVGAHQVPAVGAVGGHLPSCPSRGGGRLPREDGLKGTKARARAKMCSAACYPRALLWGELCPPQIPC